MFSIVPKYADDLLNHSNVTNFLATKPVRELLYQAGQASNGMMFIQKFVKMTQLISVNS